MVMRSEEEILTVLEDKAITENCDPSPPFEQCPTMKFTNASYWNKTKKRFFLQLKMLSTIFLITGKFFYRHSFFMAPFDTLLSPA